MENTPAKKTAKQKIKEAFKKAGDAQDRFFNHKYVSPVAKPIATGSALAWITLMNFANAQFPLSSSFNSTFGPGTGDAAWMLLNFGGAWLAGRGHLKLKEKLKLRREKKAGAQPTA